MCRLRASAIAFGTDRDKTPVAGSQFRPNLHTNCAISGNSGHLLPPHRAQQRKEIVLASLMRLSEEVDELKQHRAFSSSELRGVLRTRRLQPPSAASPRGSFFRCVTRHEQLGRLAAGLVGRRLPPWLRHPHARKWEFVCVGSPRRNRRDTLGSSRWSSLNSLVRATP